MFRELICIVIFIMIYYNALWIIYNIYFNMWSLNVCLHACILSSIVLCHLSESRHDVLFCNTYTKQASSLCMCVLWAGSFLAVMWVWTCIRWTSRGCIRSCGAAGFSPSLLMLHTSWRKCLILPGYWYWSLSGWIPVHTLLLCAKSTYSAGHAQVHT